MKECIWNALIKNNDIEKQSGGLMIFPKAKWSLFPDVIICSKNKCSLQFKKKKVNCIAIVFLNLCIDLLILYKDIKATTLRKNMKTRKLVKKI